jgi:hypothetical protein
VNTELKSSEVLESKDSIEDLNLQVVKLLNHITEDSFVMEEKTKGFNYHYTGELLSPYRFHIYIGKFTKKYDNSMIRIEAPRKGEARVLRSIFEKELALAKEISDTNNEYKPIQSKSHIITQSLNVIQPMLGILYTGTNSPFYQRNEMLGKMGIYFLVDLTIISLFALYAQNTVKSKSGLDRLLWKEGPNDLDLVNGKYTGILVSFLMVPRIYRAYEAYSETAVQNRLAELSYSFNF